MSEPFFTPTTERLYLRLPEYIRLSDARNDYLLKRWVSCTVDAQGDIDLLMNRINYTTVPDGGLPGEKSDLVDPYTADAAWLPWLAQLVGINLPLRLTEMERRDAIFFATSGYKVGTKRAVADAAKSELTGTRYARVYDHSITTPGDGGMWDVLIVTRGTETPSGAAVVDAVLKKRAKPAGVLLRHRSYTASWELSFRDSAGSIPGKYPSWGALEADNGNWIKIEEAGI